MFSRQHTHIGAHSQSLSGGNGIAVESAAVEEDEVSGLSVDFEHILELLHILFFIRNFPPISFYMFHLSLLEVGLVEVVGFGTHHETSLVVACVSEGEDALVAPDAFMDGSLVAV